MTPNPQMGTLKRLFDIYLYILSIILRSLKLPFGGWGSENTKS